MASCPLSSGAWRPLGGHTPVPHPPYTSQDLLSQREEGLPAGDAIGRPAERVEHRLADQAEPVGGTSPSLLQSREGEKQRGVTYGPIISYICWYLRQEELSFIRALKVRALKYKHVIRNQNWQAGERELRLALSLLFSSSA